MIPVSSRIELDSVKLAYGVSVTLVEAAEYDEHIALPALMALCRSVALQAPIKQDPTSAGLKAHWQEISLGAQLAAAKAETRHEVYL